MGVTPIAWNRCANKKKKGKKICKHDQTHLKCTVTVQVSLGFKITHPPFFLSLLYIFMGILKTKTKKNWFYRVTKMMKFWYIQKWLLHSRFRLTAPVAPVAFSIGVNITITNPDVSVVVTMFTFFLREAKGPFLAV